MRIKTFNTRKLYSILLTALFAIPVWQGVKGQTPQYFGHTLVACEQGTVKSFGRNNSCQLGIGGTSPDFHNTPVNVFPDSVNDAVAVAVGASHSLALLRSGKVVGWGVNVAGQTGQPSATSTICIPKVVPGLCCCVVAIAAGQQFSVALLADSTVVTWGSNQYGQLGDDNAPVGGNSPRPVVGINNAIAISAGGDFALALLADSTVVAWGRGDFGQLGNGTAHSDVPIPVTILQKIVRIDAGLNHSIALRDNNTVYTWGDNKEGQLGVGSTPSYSSTPLIPSGLTGVNIIDVAAGSAQSFVLRSNATTKVFGLNDYGQLGISSPASTNTPVNGPTISGAVDIVAPPTQMHNWAITSSGTVYTWGRNYSAAGALGIGSTASFVATPSLVTLGCTALPSKPYHPQPCCVTVIEDERMVIGTNGGTLTLTGTQTFSGLNMAIFGTVILDGNRTFSGCDVVMGKDAKIIVNGGRTLNIHTNSHFYACSDMWDGIVVNNNGRIYVQTGSIIEDAEIAVDVKYGALYTLNNATFNRNYMHVKKSMPPSGSPSLTADYRIVKCKFFCHTTPAGVTPDSLLPPRSTQRTNVAIYAVDVPKILVGNTLANANTFSNTDFGIFTDGVSRVEARFNTLRDIAYIGVSCWDGPGTGTETVAISRNTLQRMPTGIYCFDNPKATVKIDTNTITFVGMVSPPQVMTGIRVEEIVPGNSTFPNKLRIMGNTIQHAPCGIHLMNLYGNIYPSVTTFVGENTITHTKIPNDAQSGILMQNVSGANVRSNNVSHPSNAVNWWETGIRCSGTTNWFFCNNTHHVGNGLFFDNDNRPSTLLVQNTMDHNGTGLFLNWAIIGAQGSSIGDPNDNIWTTTTSWSSSNPHILSYGSGAIGTQSPFHVQSPGAQFYPTFREVALLGVQVPNPTTTSKFWKEGCLFNPPSYKTEEENPALAEALQMVSENDDAQPQTERERSIRWNGQFGLYRQLLENEEFRHSDESLLTYFLEKDGGNMGLLHRWMSEFQALRSGGADGLTSETLGLVSTIVSDHLPEQRLAEVLGILYANVAELGIMHDASASRLREIAQMCPLDEGLAVYVSRSALQSIDTLPQNYLSECEKAPAIGSVKEKQELENSLDPLFRAYPNPNSGVLTIELNSTETVTGTVSLYDMVGHTVFVRDLTLIDGGSEIQLSEVPTGLYLLKMAVDGRTEQTQRISVIRQ